MTDPEQRYLDIVKHIVKDSRGTIPEDERSPLNRSRDMLGLSPGTAAAVEQRVLNAYQAFLARSSHHSSQQSLASGSALQQQIGQDIYLDSSTDAQEAERVEQYRQAYRQACHQGSPLEATTRSNLKYLQQTLNLSDEEVQQVEASVTTELREIEEAQQEKRRWYAEEFAKSVDGDRLVADPDASDRLLKLQQDLGLKSEEVLQIERQVFASKSGSDPDQFADPAILTQPFNPDAGSASDSLPPTRLQATGSQFSGNGVSSLPSHYRELVNCLQAQQWKQADLETLRLMLKVTEQEQQGWLSPEAIALLPCDDLKQIDRLWGEYSNEKFSFRRQWRIYYTMPLPKPSVLRLSNVNYDQALAFSKAVGWWRSGFEFYKYYNQLTFAPGSSDVPDGHLPALWFWHIPWWRAVRYGGLWASRGGCSVDVQTLSAFMQKLQDCRIE
ncbi:MAG: hypothetical protein Kow00121_46710 [Elainellaceae cyanobacterium]